jgi:hypothetical protein
VTVDGAGISAGDAVPDGADAAELFDIEMDDAAGIRHDSESRKSVNTTGRSTGGRLRTCCSVKVCGHLPPKRLSQTIATHE